MRRVGRAGGWVGGYVWDYAEGMQLMRQFWDAAAALDPAAVELDEARRFPLCAPEPLRAPVRGGRAARREVRGITVREVFADFDEVLAAVPRRAGAGARLLRARCPRTAGTRCGSGSARCCPPGPTAPSRSTPGPGPCAAGSRGLNLPAMRLGVLDVGSNTVHLLVVDAHRGGHPNPMTSEKTQLRLAEHLDDAGRLTAERSGRAGAGRAPGEGGRRGGRAARSCSRSPPPRCATRRTRPRCCERVRAETGVGLQVMPGEDEARYTFLAVRRWYGWSAGRLLVLDIGGGSLELAAGRDEDPDVAGSLPLGAGRLTRALVPQPTRRRARRSTRCAEQLDAELAPVAGRSARAGRARARRRHLEDVPVAGPADRGRARPAAGPRARRVLTEAGLRQLVAFISRMSSRDLAELEGVSAGRAHQLVAGALVAGAAMRALRRAGAGDLPVGAARGGHPAPAGHARRGEPAGTARRPLTDRRARRTSG